MQLDRRALNRLLSLSDRQLETVIERLASEYGLDLSSFQIKEGDMESLRRALGSATDEDLLRLGEQLKNGGGRK